MTITKADLADIIHDHCGGPKAGSERAVEAIFERLIAAARNGEVAQFRGFGSFLPAHRKARTNTRNPRTGDMIPTPARTSIRFKPAPILRTALNGAAD